MSCREVKRLLRGTYSGGGYKQTYPFHTASGQGYGRPIIYFRGGWRCTTGAGGAGCWNATHRRFDVIDTGATHKVAITAETR